MERLFQKPPFCLIAGGGFPFTHSEVYHIHTSLCNLIHSSVGIYTTHSAVYIYKVTKSLIYKYNKNLIFDFLFFFERITVDSPRRYPFSNSIRKFVGECWRTTFLDTGNLTQDTTRPLANIGVRKGSQCLISGRFSTPSTSSCAGPRLRRAGCRAARRAVRR